MHFSAFTSHKDPSAPLRNDDRIVAYGGRLFAVIDGVTAKKGPPLPDGSSRGQAAGALIEQTLRDLVDERVAMSAGSDEVMDRIRRRFVTEYARLGMEAEAEDPHLRFGAQLAAAFTDGSTWRLLVVGDSGLRLDGAEVIATPNRGDAVIALLRAAVFTAAREHLNRDRDRAPVGAPDGGTALESVNTDRALAVARAYTVAGMSAFLPGFDDALPRDLYRACTTASEAEAVAAFPDLGPDLVRDTLRNGLLGIGKHRNSLGPLGAPCIDGTPVPLELVHERVIAADSVRSIELFSDGYFGTPPTGDVSVAAWEAHIAQVESVDPFKVGRYPSTKGSSSGLYTDDRSVLIVTA